MSYRRRWIVLLAALVLPAPAGAQGLARRILTDSTGALGASAVSPDRRWLVYMMDHGEHSSEMFIRPFEGGTARRLLEVAGAHRWPMFTPQGDRLVFLSSIPRRSATDIGQYLMAAPFDTRTGRLTAPPRQITLEPVRPQPAFRPAIRPDGREVAYVECCSNSALRVVPIEGGTARSLYTPPDAAFRGAPRALGWSSDGRAVLLTVTAADGTVRRVRIDQSGGPLAQVTTTLPVEARPIPWGRGYFTYHLPAPGGSPTLRFLDESGQPIGADVELPGMGGTGLGQVFPTADGRSLMVASHDVTATIKVASTEGNNIRTLIAPETYDWPMGWSPDSRMTHIATADREGRAVFKVVALDGKLVYRQPAPLATPRRDVGQTRWRGVLGDEVILEEGPRVPGAALTLHAMRMDNGQTRILATGVHVAGCCGVPAFTDPSRVELHYVRRDGEQMEVHAVNAAGRDRVVARLPARLIGSTEIAVSGDAVAWFDPAGDSIRVRVGRLGGQPRTVATFAKGVATGELAWSPDARWLAIAQAVGADIEVHQFDESGAPAGEPLRATLPFTYHYWLQWLPDGSGFLTLGQTRDAPAPHVARVNLASPTRPVILTRSDTTAKWGYMLSPDGKWVAYPSEKFHASSLWMLDIEQALAEARKGR